jgi:hypothetical protein
MKRMLIVIVAMGLLGACKEKDKAKDNSEPAPKSVAGCKEQTAELKIWIQGLVDGKPTTAPWPTGDAAFDAEVPNLRDETRELYKPADPAAKREPLASGVQPGRLDKELADCGPATAQITKIGEAAPTDRAAAWDNLADAIGACDCKPSIPRVKALLYLMHRGAD